MDFIHHLWLPILASTAAVWIVSALAWMLVGHHKGDWRAVPREDEFIATVKRMGIAPGSYGFPEFRRLEGMSKEEKRAKMEEMQRSPMGILRVWGPVSMGRNMLLTLLVLFITSVLIAYLGWNALPHGTALGETRPGFAKVMQVLGTAGVLAYCVAGLPNDIWFQRSAREIVMCLIDGIVFGLLTGAVFAWLWPA